MSTIYTDGAGNKYLGDCQWGNHAISYPTTNYPIFATSPTLQELFDDFNGVFTAAGYNNIYTPSTVPAYGSAADIFRFTFPSVTDPNRGFKRRQNPINYNYLDTITVNNGSLTGINTLGWGQIIGHFQYEERFPEVVPGLHYSVVCGNKSFGCIMHSPAPSINKSYTDTDFVFYALLEDVNPNFSYYTDILNHSVLFQYMFQPIHNNLFTATPSALVFNASMSLRANHYIVGATKALLQSGRAAYTIDCSDGQTPGAQWATDMWVYDNNAILGYPVIGRVPNMLLGIGSYTYLKPVKIIDTAFPDGGSPWYLPVGVFAGKTLLMRCYSSMT